MKLRMDFKTMALQRKREKKAKRNRSARHVAIARASDR